jgi:tetratricopeptide (TPR) repeat protein
MRGPLLGSAYNRGFPVETAMPVHPMELWQRAERLLQARDYASAKDSYVLLLDEPAFAIMAHLRLSLIASQQGRYRDAVGHAVNAGSRRPSDPELIEMVGKRLLTLGEHELAIRCALSPAMIDSKKPAVTAQLGKVMVDYGEPEVALKLLQVATSPGWDSAALRYLVGISALYVGDRKLAERALDGALALDPDFARAARAKSRLRTQTRESNNVDALRASLARIGEDHSDAPMLLYALFKELDDLDDAAAAWDALERGMRLRRQQVAYDPAADAAMFERLHQVRGETPSEALSTEGPLPIFIVGMPRSGTTLLERILGAHEDVADAGELRDFTMQLRWMCDLAGGPFPDNALVDAARQLHEWPQLGARYIAHAGWRSRGKRMFTDKLPLNFLNVGYIARALPQARILHMVRDPMDTCFSNLKELFANPYPHSYDQLEMADHYRRYRQLMAHWRAQFPGRIHEVHYAELVAEPERVAREALSFCGLPWQDGILEIEHRGGTVATASATQVREPIHQRSVGQWRRYETQLAPMRERLGAYGY